MTNATKERPALSRPLTEGEKYYHSVRLRTLLADRDISAAEVGQEMGVSRERVSQFLSEKPPRTGRGIATEAVLDRIEDAIQAIIDLRSLQILERDLELEDYFAELAVSGLLLPEEHLSRTIALSSERASAGVGSGTLSASRRLKVEGIPGEENPPRFNPYGGARR